MGIHIPNAMATVMESPFDTCGNEAASQAGNIDAQSVSPELNALNGNSLGFQDQQNGECFPLIDRPPVGDSTIPQLHNH